MNISNKDKFGYINDYDGRMSLSSTALPSKYLDAVKKCARELKNKDIEKNRINPVPIDEEQTIYELVEEKKITDQEYFEKAKEIILQKLCTPEVMEYAEQLKYKVAVQDAMKKLDLAKQELEAASEEQKPKAEEAVQIAQEKLDKLLNKEQVGNEDTTETDSQDGKNQIFTDEFYLEFAIEKFRDRDKAKVSALLAKMMEIRNPVPNSAWAGYSYEEILNMADDGFYVPDDVLKWAHEQKDADVYTYVLMNDEVNSNSSSDSVSNSSDVNEQQKLEKAFIEKSEQKQKLIKENLEEIKAYERAIQNLKAKSNTQASILKQIQHDVAEWKVLDVKKNKGGLNPSELERYNEIQQNLQDSTASQEIEKTSGILVDYVSRIENLNDECVDAKAIITELNNLTTTNSQTEKNSDTISAGVDAVKSRNISAGINNDTIYGITNGNLSVLAVQSVSDLNSTITEATNYLSSTSDLVQFAEKYYEELNNIDIHLDSRFKKADGAGKTTSTAEILSDPASEEKHKENELYDSPAEDVGYGGAAMSLASIGVYAVQVAAVALISSGAFPVSALGLMGVLAGMVALHKVQTKLQEKTRDKVATDTQRLEEGITVSRTESNGLINLTKNLTALFNKNTKKSDSLMKELVKLFTEQTKIDKETSKDKEKETKEQVKEVQKIELKPDGTPKEPKLPKENKKAEKKAEAKKKTNNKKIDRITKQVGSFSKENKDISEKIENSIPQIKQITQQNDSARKKLDIDNKMMGLSGVALALSSTGRMIDGTVFTAFGAAGLVSCAVVAGIGASLLSNPFTHALGIMLIKNSAKSALTCGAVTMAGVASIKSGIDGFKEVGNTMSQSDDTGDTMSREKSEAQSAMSIAEESMNTYMGFDEETEEKDKVDAEKTKKGNKDVKQAEKEKKKVVKAAKKTLKKALKDAKKQYKELKQEAEESKAEGQENPDESANTDKAQANVEQNPVINPNAQNNSQNQDDQTEDGQNNSKNKEVVSSPNAQNSNSESDENSESSDAATEIAGQAVSGGAESSKEDEGEEETTEIVEETENEDEQASSEADDALNRYLKMFLVSKISELGVSQELQNKINKKFDTTKFVSAIKEKIAGGQDVQEAIEDVIIAKLNSMDIDSIEDSSNIGVREDKYSEKQRQVRKAYFSNKLNQFGRNNSANSQGFLISQGASSNNSSNSTNNNPSDKTTDSKEARIIDRTDSVVSRANAIPTPEVDVQDPAVPQEQLSNNIDTVSSLQNELDELDMDANNLKDKSKAQKRVNNAKELLSSILNRQISKMKTLSAATNEEDFDNMPIISDSAENEEITRSAAASISNQSANNITSDNIDRKLSDFNADSMKDLLRKNKKVVGTRRTSGNKR